MRYGGPVDDGRSPTAMSLLRLLLHQWFGGTSLVPSTAVTYAFAFLDMIQSSTFPVTLLLQIIFRLFAFCSTYLPKSLIILLPFISLTWLSSFILVFVTISLFPLV